MSPRAITPFLRGNTWWARVPRMEANAIQRSLGVAGKQNKDVANDVCRFLSWLRGRIGAENWLLEAMATGQVAIAPAYNAYVEGRLPAFISEARHGAEDVDLEPYVARWQKELERRKRPSADSRNRYLNKVRTLLPEDTPFRRSQFTKARVMAWLQETGVGQPNRYRAALSSFAEYLLLLDVIPVNPVRQVPMASESDPRTLHLSVGDATALVGVLDGPCKALHALILSTGMEVGAALALRRRDIDLDAMTVYASGTKRTTRQRTCHVYATWEPMFANVVSYIDGMLPDAEVFPGITRWDAIAELRKGLKAKRLPMEYRTHDHRHTWAVQALRDGIEDHAVAYQLGHGNARMLREVYGRYIPRRSDFAPKVTASATAPIMRSVK